MRLAIKDGKVHCPKKDKEVKVVKHCLGGYGYLHKKECDHFGWYESNSCIVCRYSQEREKRLKLLNK